MTSRWIRVTAVLASVLVGLGAPGCSRQESESASQERFNKDMLLEFAELLKAHVRDHKKPPSKAADVASYEPIYPTAHVGIVKKDIVYPWGVGLTSGGDAGSTVLAYQKDVETKGGWALMQDGTVKELTAEQFKAAPKAHR